MAVDRVVDKFLASHYTTLSSSVHAIGQFSEQFYSLKGTVRELRDQASLVPLAPAPEAQTNKQANKTNMTDPIMSPCIAGEGYAAAVERGDAGAADSRALGAQGHTPSPLFRIQLTILPFFLASPFRWLVSWSTCTRWRF